MNHRSGRGAGYIAPLIVLAFLIVLPAFGSKFFVEFVVTRALILGLVASTLVFLSTLDPETRKSKVKGNVTGAKSLGAAFAAKAKAAGITAVVFDRNGRLFHGRVKTFADAAREGGLKF